MRNWIGRNAKHFLIWAVLLVYLFSANSLYVHFILKNGKPVSTNVALPAVANDVIYKLADVLQPIRVDGQDLYEIKGYAFQRGNPKGTNTIRVVLSTEKSNLVFPTRDVQFPNMIESYPAYTKGMEQAEFSFLVSKNVLAPGTYKIGILLEAPGSGSPLYVVTSGKLQTTPNTIKYVPGS